MNHERDPIFGKSFGERHPVISTVLIIAYIAISLPPAIIMFLRWP